MNNIICENCNIKTNENYTRNCDDCGKIICEECYCLVYKHDDWEEFYLCSECKEQYN